MSKSRKKRKQREPFPKLPSRTPDKPAAAPPSHAMRETIESIVIAFVLAFLFRTFEAEAFVIPTGSMAPTLMGRHKDLVCPQCGHRFQITASEEESDEVKAMQARLDQGRLSPLERANLANRVNSALCVGGMCPVCRYVMPVKSGLPPEVTLEPDADTIVDHRSYNGDRILVNKYIYALADPQRWDVVVFKFPGNAQMNYIKRLVGLPGETVRIYQGDLFVAKGDAPADADYHIARKPPDKVLAMRQLVHDTNYDPVDLYAAGWPLRWHADDAPAGGWTTELAAGGKTVRQQYTSSKTGETAWLRYRHYLPSYDVWLHVAEQEHAAGDALPTPAQLPPDLAQQKRPALITDFTDYNARVLLGSVERNGSLEVDFVRHGIHWVGDLMLSADVDVKSAEGKLWLELTEGGRDFICSIDLSTGLATLGIEGVDEFAPTAGTPLRAPGRYRVALANVDDQLLVWVDDKLVQFDGSTAYDADELYGSRSENVPHYSADDPGDLAPAGVGAENAELTVTRLQLWRDIYYIADSWQRPRRGQLVTDFPNPSADMLANIAIDPLLWDAFADRQMEDFPLEEEQYFVMGDNSPESLDARLWRGGSQEDRGRPGGSYLERRQLIGKALCVYWPHSWNRIPGTPISLPLFPNFEDMRLVR